MEQYLAMLHIWKWNPRKDREADSIFGEITNEKYPNVIKTKSKHIQVQWSLSRRNVKNSMSSYIIIKFPKTSNTKRILEAEKKRYITYRGAIERIKQTYQKLWKSE